MDELDEVIGKLTAAALQISPKDDQIIAGHIRDSVALLLQYRHKIRGHNMRGRARTQMKPPEGTA